MNTHLFPENLLLGGGRSGRSQIHDLQFRGLQHTVLGELDVGFSGILFDADVPKVPIKAVTGIPTGRTNSFARQLGVQRSALVFGVVREVLDAVRVHLDGGRDFVKKTGAGRVKVDSCKTKVVTSLITDCKQST